MIVPKTWRRDYLLSLLVLAYVVAFIDRSILSLLVIPIKQDLSLSDTQIGILQGIAFSFFYVGAGLPLARLADRYSRRNLIAGGLVLWCLATALGGLAVGFFSLLVARILVGVGEATLTPSATSIISDIYPTRRISWAMSIYGAAPFVGMGLALVLGGWFLDGAKLGGAQWIPYLGDMQSWQIAFLLVGLPGLALAALFMLTVREPTRKGQSQDGLQGEMPSIREFAAHVIKNRKLYGMIFVGGAMVSLVGYALSAWMPLYYAREFAETPSRIGKLLGLAIMIGGPIGVLVGGWIGDHLRPRLGDITIPLSLIGSVGTFALAWAALIVDSFELSALLILPLYAIKMLPTGPSYAAILLLTPNRMRAQIVALWLLVNSLIGMGLGPLAVGLVTDYFIRDEMLLGQSLLIVISGSMLVATFCFAMIRNEWSDVVNRTISAAAVVESNDEEKEQGHKHRF